MSKWNTDDLHGSETIPYDETMVDTCHYTFLQVHRICNTKSEAQCKLRTLDDNEMSVQAHSGTRC